MKLWNMLMGCFREQPKPEIIEEQIQPQTQSESNTMLKPSMPNIVRMIAGERNIELPEKMEIFRPQALRLKPQNLFSRESIKKKTPVTLPHPQWRKDSSSSDSDLEVKHKSPRKKPLPPSSGRKRAAPESLDIVSEFKNMEKMLVNTIQDRLNEFVEVRKSELELKIERSKRIKEKFFKAKKKALDCEVQTDPMEPPRKIEPQVQPSLVHSSPLNMKKTEEPAKEIASSSPITKSNFSDSLFHSKPTDSILSQPSSSLIGSLNPISTEKKKDKLTVPSSSLFQNPDKKLEPPKTEEPKISLGSSSVGLFGLSKKEELNKPLFERSEETTNTKAEIKPTIEGPKLNLFTNQKPILSSDSPKQETPKIDLFSHSPSSSLFTSTSAPKQEEKKSSESSSIPSSNSLFGAPSTGEILPATTIFSSLSEAKKEDKKQESNPFINPPSMNQFKNIFGNSPSKPQIPAKPSSENSSSTPTSTPAPSIVPTKPISSFESSSSSWIHSVQKPSSTENSTTTQPTQSLFGPSTAPLITSTPPSSTPLFSTPLSSTSNEPKLSGNNTLFKGGEMQSKNPEPSSIFGNNSTGTSTLFGNSNSNSIFNSSPPKPQSDALFGNNKSGGAISSGNTGPNLFQSPAPLSSSPSTGLFGGATTTATPGEIKSFQASTTSLPTPLFGAGAPPSSSTLFGAPAPSNSTLFGGSTPGSNALFGATPSTGPSYMGASAPTGPSLMGAPVSTGQSLFGASPTGFLGSSPGAFLSSPSGMPKPANSGSSSFTMGAKPKKKQSTSFSQFNLLFLE